MFTSKHKLDADIKEIEYLTEVLKSAQKWNTESDRVKSFHDFSIRIKSVVDDLELVKRSLKCQIKF
jgi:hypothetical protein